MSEHKAELSYEESYLGQLRALVGQRKLLIVTVRAVIQDGAGRVLLIRRSDNGRWGMPAGAMELDESVSDALRREVFEETGLTAIEFTLIAIYSHPRYTAVTSYGDPYQFVAHVFRVDAWEGELVTATDETTDARFFALDALPDDLSTLYRETLEDARRFDGRVIVK
jgi:ADP-ribose pyrophosphatase YjhB (NUDIX family)